MILFTCYILIITYMLFKFALNKYAIKEKLMFHYYALIFCINLVSIIDNILQTIINIHPLVKLTLLFIVIFIFCVFLSKYALTNSL